jgi:hypothetical protein
VILKVFSHPKVFGGLICKIMVVQTTPTIDTTFAGVSGSLPAHAPVGWPHPLLAVKIKKSETWLSGTLLVDPSTLSTRIAFFLKLDFK